MPAPQLNIGIDQLRNMMSRGAMGSTPQPSPSGMATMSPASGGATAGVKANPSRSGMPPMHTGQPAMGSKPPAPRGGPPMGVPAQPGAKPHEHALTLASLTHLQKMGHGHPNHHAIAGQARAGIASSKGMGAPKSRGGFGALGGGGGSIPTMGSSGMDGSPAAPTSIPGATAGAQGNPPEVA